MVNTKAFKILMIQRDMTQSELAQRMGISATGLRQKLSNVRSMKISEAEMIQHELDIPDELFCFYFCYRGDQGVMDAK